MGALRPLRCSAGGGTLAVRASKRPFFQVTRPPERRAALPGPGSDLSQTRGRAAKTGFVQATSSKAADHEPVLPKNSPPSQVPSGVCV